MRLYLVRHAEAKPKEQDPDRHLTSRGAREVAKLAAFLRPLGLRVRVIQHSGKARAAQTAELLAEAFPAAKGVKARKGMAPDDPVDRIADEIEQEDEDLMLVGHLPFMSRLAARLLTGDEERDVIAFPLTTVLCLERDEDKVWRVLWALTPELLP